MAILNCDDCGQSFRIQKEVSQNWINWGVSDHPKAGPKAISFWKHQFVVNNHTILMNQIWSIVKVLNHSWNFFGREFLYFGGFFVFKIQLTALWLLCLTTMDKIARKHHINIYLGSKPITALYVSSLLQAHPFFYATPNTQTTAGIGFQLHSM
jgi:hypothetical protein